MTMRRAAQCANGVAGYPTIKENITAEATTLAFLRGDSRSVAAEIANVDWAATSLGSPDQWPASLRSLISTMLACPAPMFLAWGPDLLSFYNDAYRPILGYRASSAMGKPFRELWASIWTDIEPLVDETLAGGSPQVTDMELDLSRGGEPEESYWSFSYSPAFDDDGAIAGMLCVTSETTDRVFAERQRAEADARLELALSAGDGIGTWDWDVVNDCVRADSRFALLYGVSPQDARDGAPLQAFFGAIHADDVRRVQTEIAAAMSGQGHFKTEYRLEQPGRDVRWVSAQGSCIFDDQGRCVRFPGVSHDITERVQAEQRIRHSEAEARKNAERVQLALAAGAIIGTWLWDLPTDRFTVDEGFATNFGLDPALGRA